MKEKIVNWANSFIQPAVAGLDISDRSVKYIKFGEKNIAEFDAFGEFFIPEGIIVNGEIKKEDELAKVFKEWLDKDGRRLRRDFLVVSLPEEKSFLRLIKLPKVKQEDVKNAIIWEIEANIPMPVEEITHDYEIVDGPVEKTDHLDVVVTAFPKSIVWAYLRVLKGLGFKVLALELESQAIVRSVVPNLEEKILRIIIDIGRHRTSFIIFTGGAIVFTATIEFGGVIIEENIMKVLRVDSEKAAAIKKNYGLSKKDFEGKLFAAISPAIAALADELKRALRYYVDHIKHVHGAKSEVGEILLVGGDSSLLGLDTYLASSMKTVVKLADPFTTLKNRSNESFVPPLPKNQALAFTTAIGLTLREMR